MDNEKKGIFSWFNMRKANRPDAVAEDTTPTVKRYFKLLGRRFWQLVSLNIMMLPMIIPIIAIIYLYIGMRQTPIELTSAFSPLYGANLIEQTPTTAYMLDLFGGQLMIPVYTTTNYIFMAIFALLLAITFGWQNVGATYVLRGMVRGEAVFPFSDYFYAIKRNLKQGFFMGLIDFVVIFLLGFDLLYLWNAPVGLGNDLLFGGIVALTIIYFFMRFYIYLMLVTFELSIRKILKNALIFTILGIKRNLMGFLGILLMTALNVSLFFLMASTPLGIAIPLILPLLYYLSFTAFTASFAAYPVIDRYMIAPYAKHTDDEDDLEEEAKVE